MRKSSWYVMGGDPVIETIGRVSSTNLHPSRIVPFWVLGIVNSGQRTVKLRNLKMYLSTGDYFLLPPQVPHEGIEIDTHDVFFIHFYMKGGMRLPPAEKIDEQILVPLYGQLPTDLDLICFLKHLNSYYQLGTLGSPFFCVQLKALLYQISVYEQRKAIGYIHKNMPAEKIYQYIGDHYTEHLDSRTFENEFHLSYRHLNSIFRNQFNTTIKQKVMDIKIEQARILLINGESIDSVVNHLGFNDYFYFLKSFKNKMGVTPKQLQNKYKY